MSSNGRLTTAELIHVLPNERLSHPTAYAFWQLAIQGAKNGRRVTLATPGAGYRDFECQTEMREGSLGNVALARKWDLNPNSSVPLAGAGYSSHGFGTRIDLLFGGSSSPTAADLKLAAHYGFTREFGSNDPNHFMHDGHTAVQVPVWTDLTHYGIWHA